MADKLKTLLIGIHNDDTAEIDEAIEKARTILTPDSLTDLHMVPHSIPFICLLLKQRVKLFPVSARGTGTPWCNTGRSGPRGPLTLK